jgi:hypothetical protein
MPTSVSVPAMRRSDSISLTDFAFGIHSPILDYITGLLRIEALRENEADFNTKELLRSGNARRMLGV